MRIITRHRSPAAGQRWAIRAQRLALAGLLAAVWALVGCGPAPQTAPAPSRAAPAPAADSPTAGLPGRVAWPRRDNDIRFVNLSLDEGLSQSVVTALWQDRQGFIWLGTQDGLNRYDGYSFRVFKNDPADLTSLSDSYIFALAGDGEGRLWIGTNGGLNRYDPATERFERFLSNPGDPGSLGSNHVGDLLVDRSGVLWIGTLDAGLDRFDGGGFEHYRLRPDDPASLSNDTIGALHEDRAGNLWVGTIGGGLNRLDRSTGRFQRYQNDPNDPASLANDSVTSIAEDAQGDLWLATAGGLAHLDVETEKFVNYRAGGGPGALSDNTLNAVFTGRDGVLWVGTGNAGLDRFDPQTGRFVHYYPVWGDPNSIGCSAVYSIFQDRSGVLWFGTFGCGVSRYSWTSERFTRVRPIADDPTSLSGGGVWSFLEDSQGVLWVGTTSGGLNRLDPVTGEFRHYRSDPNRDDSLTSDFIMALHEDRAGRFWVGTFGGGLNLLDRDTGLARHYGPVGNVGDIMEDRAGRLWIAASTGLGYYEPETDTLGYFAHDAGDPGSLSDGGTTTVYEDREGRLWVGMFTTGLSVMNPDGRTFTHYHHDPADPRSLASDMVLAIHQDRAGTLWIGTSGGLDRFEPDGGTFTHLRERDGLPNDVIYGIVEDDSGRLWLSTNRGLSRFDARTGTFRNFTPADGLQSNEFNQSAAYRDSQGRIYFGGINGYNVFLPDEIVDNAYTAPVVVTSLSLFNNPVLPGEGSPLGQAITMADTVRLSYDQDFITFEFAALDYAAPERNKYAYRMDGLDEEWNEVSTRRFAGYTGLQPGKYIFRVRGSNSDGVWSATETAIRVIVTPPFWRTWWFRTLLGVLVLGSVAGGFTLRLCMIQAQKRRLEVLVAERTERLNEAMVELRHSRDAAEAANRAKSIFLANISHELRTPLNAILGFSQLMLGSAARHEAGTLTPAQRDNLEIISRSGEHLLGLINDVLEMSKIEAGRISLNEHSFELHRLLEDLHDMFRLRAEAKGLALDLELAPDVPRYIVSDEGKLRQVLMNLLGNAVKFTHEGGVVVRAGTQQAGPKGRGDVILIVEVEDSGLGIAPEEQEAIFEPFIQSASGRQTQEGTGLGLSICRQYAQLMGGSLAVRSEVGKGSTFTFRVPVEAVDAAGPQTAEQLRRVTGLEPGQPVYRLLVVDDKEVNRQLIVRLLAPLGFELREAANGQEAIKLWEEWQPHLIWMDMRMPVMDGYEATRHIKATLKGLATAIIALTASALEEDRQLILSEGCDDYIRKPFREREIVEALEKHLGVRFVYAPLAAPAGDETPAGREAPDGMAGRLTAVPAECVQALQQATRLAAVDSILAAIAAIRSHDPDLADVLASWAEDFQHERILALIDAAGRTSGRP